MSKYDETNVPGPEYRVRTVTRYVVTRYCFPFEARDGSHGSGGKSELIGEFPTHTAAVGVAQALADTDPNSTVDLS